MGITVTGGVTFGSGVNVSSGSGAPLVKYPVVAGGYRVYKWITSGTITF